MERKVRVRFAPSPTGPLHMGGVRTALFNYLFAKQHHGDFLLRIEDTDQTRYVPGAEEYITRSLEWCGLVPDEGQGFGGKYGPYRQSERRDIYLQYALKLVADGHAYYAFDTPEELKKFRDEAEIQKSVFSYDQHNRMTLNNSLTLTDKEIAQKLDARNSWVIRFKMPENTMVTEEDLIRGKVTFNTSQLDDKVLYKSDGMPTYHLANVVDDYLMNISHVIRGEEWLPSMPLHILLYQALGWGEVRPRFAHLPLILKPTGKGKLSKRDGDKLGFPVFPLQWKDPASGEVAKGYREEGYFREAFINMLALLGWSAGNDQEFFSMDELIDNFKLERVVKSGARFDPEKTKWFNRHYLQQKSSEELADLFLPLLEQKQLTIDATKLYPIIELIKDRCTFVQDLWEQGSYFFTDPVDYDRKTIRKKWKEDIPEKLKQILTVFQEIHNWKATTIREIFSAFINEKDWEFGTVMAPIRLALVGSSQGVDLFAICEIIGKATTIARIEQALIRIQP